MTESLQTGQRQSERNRDGEEEDFFAALYSDQARLKVFLGAMTALSGQTNRIMAEKLPWSDYQSFVDVGAAEGGLVVEIARRHSHLSGIGFDLPPVRLAFEDYVERNLPDGKIRFFGGDFFKQPLPKVDVVLMGHVLHDWDLEQKRYLLRSAYDAIPQGGMVVVYETLIDDARSQNAFGLLMSLNMLLETSGGFDYTGADCRAWMEEAGFGDIRQEHLAGPDSMMIGFKE
uniref:Ubiquinone/menaquinone biosynthesis C-methylase UbiE n=1 Tax=Candidatus Kentrum sp. DK TaxID=2126562 RepID=A0A450SKW9_9GAMM|nr:MAG: Ubiquinone/menaquinone biosynthesis C-methylase UbiE [Candidatus Kentron sp. DK]